MRRKQLLVLAALSAAAPAGAFDLFCPRADVLFSFAVSDRADKQKSLDARGSRGAPQFFPRSGVDADARPDSSAEISLKLVDCSDDDFYCRLVTFETGAGDPREFVLAVPRVIRPGTEYTYRGVRLVARLSDFSSPSNEPAAQVTIWQHVGDELIPMELTVQPSVGVLFWDGVRFRADDSPGELCAVTGGPSFFRGVSVRRR